MMNAIKLQDVQKVPSRVCLLNYGTPRLARRICEDGRIEFLAKRAFDSCVGLHDSQHDATLTMHPYILPIDILLPPST